MVVEIENSPVKPDLTEVLLLLSALSIISPSVVPTASSSSIVKVPSGRNTVTLRLFCPPPPPEPSPPGLLSEPASTNLKIVHVRGDT